MRFLKVRDDDGSLVLYRQDRLERIYRYDRYPERDHIVKFIDDNKLYEVDCVEGTGHIEGSFADINIE